MEEQRKLWPTPSIHGNYNLDLFSGIGGFALAARWAGFRTIGFCEIEVSIINIKNTFVRRSLLLVCFLPVLVFAITYESVKASLEVIEDTVAVCKSCWKGRQ
jgi:hypothetical protein